MNNYKFILEVDKLIRIVGEINYNVNLYNIIEKTECRCIKKRNIFTYY